MTTTAAPLPSSSTHAGPPLALVAASYAVLVIGGIVAGVTLAPRSGFVMPYDTAAREVAYVAAYPDAIRWSSFLQLCSAMPLLVFVAVTVSRLRFLGVRAAGELIALCGGVGAALLLIVSALADWALSTPDIADLPGAVRALQLLGFNAGGPGFVAPLGLFFLGVSISAGLYRLIPRWLMWLGVVIGIASELATFTLITWKASLFIPVGRFIGIVWMIAIALTLPKRRHQSS